MTRVAHLSQPSREGAAVGGSGLCVAILGPDGSGKSTLLDALERRAGDRFAAVRRFHLRPHVGRGRRDEGPVVDPHGKLPRGMIPSVAKLAWWWMDYWLGHLLVVGPAVRRASLVLFDRYYHDILVDPVRYRYGASIRIARAVGRSVPMPDVFVILEAPVATLRSRKREVERVETERQREAYAELAAELPGAHRVDSSRPVEDVVAEVESLMIAVLEGGST